MSAATKTVRVLPADVYDALEFSALVFGGIGAGNFSTGAAETMFGLGDGEVEPLCAHGHAYFLGGHQGCDVVSGAIYAAGITTFDNDDAVTAINARAGALATARVTFEEWCEELGVVRGES